MHLSSLMALFFQSVVWRHPVTPDKVSHNISRLVLPWYPSLYWHSTTTVISAWNEKAEKPLFSTHEKAYCKWHSVPSPPLIQDKKVKYCSRILESSTWPNLTSIPVDSGFPYSGFSLVHSARKVMITILEIMLASSVEGLWNIHFKDL